MSESQHSPRIGLVLVSAILLAVLATGAYMVFATESAAAPTPAERSQIESEFELQIQDWIDELAELRVQADAQVEIDFSDEIAALEQRIARAEVNLERLRAASGDLWLEIRIELEELQRDLSQAFARFRERLDQAS